MPVFRQGIIFLFLFICLSANGQAAQSQGYIQGNLVDETNQPLPFATVTVYQKEVLLNGMDTDFDGNYSFSGLEPGLYELEFSFLSYFTKRIIDIPVFKDSTTFLDAKMIKESNGNSQALKLNEIYHDSLGHRTRIAIKRRMCKELLRNKFKGLPNTNMGSIFIEESNVDYKITSKRQEPPQTVENSIPVQSEIKNSTFKAFDKHQIYVIKNTTAEYHDYNFRDRRRLELIDTLIKSKVKNHRKLKHTLHQYQLGKKEFNDTYKYILPHRNRGIKKEEDVTVLLDKALLNLEKKKIEVIIYWIDKGGFDWSWNTREILFYNNKLGVIYQIGDGGTEVELYRHPKYEESEILLLIDQIKNLSRLELYKANLFQTKIKTLTAEDIKTLPTKDLNEIKTTNDALSRSSNNNDSISIGAGRSSNTDYYIDGVKVNSKDPKDLLDSKKKRKIFSLKGLFKRKVKKD